MRDCRTAFVLVAFAACGGSSPGGGGDDVVQMDAPAQSAGWTTLIDKNWHLGPNSENTSDIQLLTLDRDYVIGGIRPIAPVGTHHTLLFRGLTGTNAIYASGIGTGELMFPAGKALTLPMGTTIGLQLHIYNTGDEDLSGLSGVEVVEVDPATVTDEIDLFLPGPKNTLNIPPGVSTQTGTCTINAPQTLFALFPHMHQWGTHLKTTLTRGGVDQVLHDDDYTFQHQYVETFAPITMAVGDKIKTDCTYNNDTGANIVYGESTDTEMCYSILYRYPKQSGEYCQQ